MLSHEIVLAGQLTPPAVPAHDEKMKRTFPVLVVLACLALPLQAQLPISFGLKGGARLSDFTEVFNYGPLGHAEQNTEQDHIYTIGPYAEFRLPHGFSLEADLLYKRSGATLNSYGEVFQVSDNIQQYKFNSFDVPILLKKRFGRNGIFFRPFVEGGLASRFSTGLPNASNAGTNSGWQEGAALGGGLEFKVPILTISGEFRWTHFVNISSDPLPKLNASQSEVLLGIGF